MYDLTNQRFGRLTVIRPATTEETAGRKKKHWLCICDCGKEKVIDGNHLRTGKITSCGCRRREVAGSKNFVDLTGRTFGKWTVISRSENNEHGKVMWLCQCECGTQKTVLGENLRQNLSLSCGCDRFKSKGEQKIRNLLSESNIPFVEQYYINIKGFRHYFDFYVDNKYFIEFDGQQHFIKKDFFGSLEKIKERDSRKDEYCKENEIPLIRINYHQLPSLTIKDLILKDQEESPDEE